MAVDHQIDGAQPSLTSRRGRELGERERARAATCRRRGAAGRLGVDGGRLGQQQGGGGVAGDAPPRRHSVVAVRLELELRLLLCCTWVEGGVSEGGVVREWPRGGLFIGGAARFRGRQGRSAAMPPQILYPLS